jgi:hypothetical protein
MFGLVFTSLYRIAPGVLDALVIVKPETVIRWHRAGFRLFWRWKSRTRGGRPMVPLEIRPAPSIPGDHPVHSQEPAAVLPCTAPSTIP